MSQIAQHITVDERYGLLIDGRLFPYWVNSDYQVHTESDEILAVTITVPCEALTIRDPWSSRTHFAPDFEPKPYRPGPFRPLDIAAERSRLDDLGRRITATRARTLSRGDQ